MDVLWVSHLVPHPPIAGVLARSHHLLRGVARRHNVHLVAFIQQYWLKLAYGSVSEGLSIARDALSEWATTVSLVPIPSEERAFGREMTAIRALLGDPYSIRWLSSAAARREIADVAQRVCPDVSHFDTISLAQYRSCIQTGSCTLGHHNVESHMLTRRGEQERNPMKRWYFLQEGRRLRDYESSHARMFDLHITCSPLDSQRLAEIVGEVPIVDVPNGVDIDFFRPSEEPPASSDLVFIGTMNWYPNVDAMRFFASQVWPSIRDRHPESAFHMIGASPPADLVTLGYSDPRFCVHGFVDDVRPIAHRAAVFVCPIRDGGGTKLKVLDAFAMGCAVVAHPLAIEGIDALDGTHFVAATTPDEFVERISSLLTDPDRRQRIGAAARSLACDRYSFASLGGRFADALESTAMES